MDMLKKITTPEVECQCVIMADIKKSGYKHKNYIHDGIVNEINE